MVNSQRIIQSLLDLDFYKLTMAQVAWKHFPNIPVQYSFKNRTTSINLSDYISEEELRLELNHVRQLRFTDEEIAYLRENQYFKAGFFQEDFLNFLRGLRLPNVDVKKENTGYKIDIRGTWSETILWETLVLSIVNELYYRSLLSKTNRELSEARREGLRRLNHKIKILKRNPKVIFVEFGTRRRFSRDWQEFVVRRLAAELPNSQLLGTSNVLLAKKLNLRPVGTFAHEMFMIFAGIYHDSDNDVRASHNKVLQVWWETYGEPLSIALTDTFGSDFFFQDFTKEQAQNWRGLRQDSGDPIEFGERAIEFYKQKGIDPKTKLILFSDGLELGTILRLNKHFFGRIKVSFGWGTNLTNDCGFKPLSLVVKPVRSCGQPIVKLSDNIAKAIGRPEVIERFKRIFDYHTRFDEACTY